MLYSLNMPRHDTRTVSGVDFDFVPTSDVTRLVDVWRRSGRRCYVTLVNPHSVMTAKRDQRMRAAIDGADLVLPDGVGIVLGARLLGYGCRHRVTGPNLMLHLCDAGRELGLRHFFYGGAEGIAPRLAERLTELYPGLNIAGTYTPPFRELSDEEDEAAVRLINAARPDVLWVGMGAPKQEKWMAEHRGRVHACAMIGVGAAFDFHSGNIRWAPRWVRRMGCEWAYRLVLEPKRMWRRNLDSPLFLFHVLGQRTVRVLGRMVNGVRALGDSLSFHEDPPQGGSGQSASLPLPLGQRQPQAEAV